MGWFSGFLHLLLKFIPGQHLAASYWSSCCMLPRFHPVRIWPCCVIICQFGPSAFRHIWLDFWHWLWVHRLRWRSRNTKILQIQAGNRLWHLVKWSRHWCPSNGISDGLSRNQLRYTRNTATFCDFGCTSLLLWPYIWLAKHEKRMLLKGNIPCASKKRRTTKTNLEEQGLFGQLYCLLDVWVWLLCAICSYGKLYLQAVLLIYPLLL